MSTTATVRIVLSPSNDAPVLSSGASFVSPAEDVGGLTPVTILSLLGSKFTDSDNVAGNALAGVAVGAFDDKGLGNWQIKIGEGAWTNLSDVSGTITTANALLLAADTQIQFVANAHANTAGLSGAALPSISVFGVENLAPTGASTVAAPAISFTTAVASPLFYNTTTDTGESRVAALAVTIDTSIAAQNDAPVLSGTSYTGTLTESAVVGVGTPTQLLLTGVTVSDLDLGTTSTLGSTVFGAGSITVSLAGRATGDKFTLAGGLTAGVASTTGSDVASGNYVIQLSNTATVAQVTVILQAIQFENTSDAPPAGARTYTVTLNDGNNLDAQDDTAGGPTVLDATTVLGGSITITELNDPPTLSVTTATTTYTENATARLLFSAADALTDQIVHDQTIIKMTLTISGLVNGTAEKLTIDGTEVALVDGTSATTGGNVTVVLASGTATVTFTPSAGITEAQTNTLIDTLAYSNSSEDPTAGARVVTITSLQDNINRDGGAGE